VSNENKIFIAEKPILNLSCIFLFFGNAFSKTILKVSYEDWSPFQFQDSQKRIAGLDIELV